MNHSRHPLPGAAPLARPAGALAEPPLPGYVRHAILDARAGLPVAIYCQDGGHAPLAALAAETATEAGLAAFRAATVGEPQLVLAPTRAEALRRLQPGARDAGESSRLRAEAGSDEIARDGVYAFRCGAPLLTPAALLALADPTRPADLAGPLTPATPLPAADAALLLAKLGRLLPAMLVAEARDGHGLVAVSDAAIIAFKQAETATLVRVAEAAVPLAEAPDARLVAFRPADGGTEHVALLIGRPEDAPPAGDAPLVRIHSECFTGDLLGSLRCDCGPQLHQAIQRMQAEGSGVLLYMAQEGRGIGLVNKLRAYALQDRGLDTLDANRALGWGADERSFGAAAVMLRDLGITRVRLLTNNPDKVASLQAAGIEVTGRLRHAIAANGVNDGYLDTKARRFGHLLG